MGDNGNWRHYPQNQSVRQAGLTLIDKYMIHPTHEQKAPDGRALHRSRADRERRNDAGKKVNDTAVDAFT